VSVSEHEGFGVPILEAMAAGVPVVAYGSTAVPETMGGAGVLMRSKDPAVIAATVEAVQSDHELRARIIERQKTRVEQVQGLTREGCSSESLGEPTAKCYLWKYRFRAHSKRATALRR